MSKQLKAYGLFVVLFTIPLATHASPDLLRNNDRCQILFTLKGDGQQLFEQQVEQLTLHIERLPVDLLDLNRPHTTKPYTSLSGRKRRQLKRWLELVDDKSTAIIMLNRSKIFQGSGDIDLTLLLQTCQKYTR